MKIDNKGVTLVEIIVSITLISIVLIFLLRLLISLRDLDDKSLSMLKYEEKTALIVDAVQSEIKDKNCEGGVVINNSYESNVYKIPLYCGTNTYYLTTSKYSNLKAIEFDGETWKFPLDTTFKNINIWMDGKLLMATVDVIDDKGNTYPIEISHYNTE